MLIRMAGLGLATAAMMFFATCARAQTVRSPGTLGVVTRPLEGVELQQHGSGVALLAIAPGGAAEHGGLKAGDIVTAVDGKPFDGPTFAALMRSYPSGSKVSLQVFRSGQPSDVIVQLGQLVADPAAWGVFLDLAGKKWLLEPDRRDILTFEWVGPEHLRQTLRPFGSTVGVYKMDVTYVAASRSLQLTYSWGEHVPGTTAPDGSVTFRGKTQLFISDQRGFRRRDDGGIEYWVKHAGSEVHPLSPTDAATEARMLEAQRERIAEEKRLAREKSERFDAAMGALYGALTEANELADVRVAESRKALDATLAQVAAQARGNAPTGQAQADATLTSGSRTAMPGGAVAASGQTDHDVATTTSGAEAHAGPGAPLRFVLLIGLQPRAGDSVNPTCYSNVLVRSGPPGWAQGGSLPPGSEGIARATVEGMKSAFIAACEAASGRKVTSQGDFQWMWNEFRDGESQIANARARYREDVTVNL